MNTPDTECGCTNKKYCEKHFNEAVRKDHPELEKNTPDTEWEKAELAVFWDEIAQHLPKCMERNALGDEKIFHAFATAYPKIKKHIISSRDTYWKEGVEEFKRKAAKSFIGSISDAQPSFDDPQSAYIESSFFHALNHSAVDIFNEDNLK